MGRRDLTIDSFLWRAEHLFPEKSITSYVEDGPTTYGYAEYADRVARLASALADSGIGVGDRVASCAWNHHRHFEAYYAVPNLGATLHTINPMLPDRHIQYMVEQAADRLIFVDPETVERIEGALAGHEAESAVEQYVVMGETVPETELEPVTSYESFVRGYDGSFDWPTVSEDQPLGLCFTSGTTGKPKGVEYTHRMLWTNTMSNLTPQGHGVTESDVVLHTVPMFHVAGWGLPYSATAAGAAQVYPGPAPSSAKLARLIEEEGVTLTAGVPTVWIDLLEYVETNDVDLSSLRRIIAGGAPIPESVIRTYRDTHGVEMRQVWGMTETFTGAISYPTSAVRDAGTEAEVRKRARAGLPPPGVEFKLLDDEGEELPWDGESYGTLVVRGPWFADGYFERPDATAEAFDGDWFHTGDIATVDSDGYIDIVDREDDMIKSGGEWISSVELENTLMEHEAVREAAVIGIPDDRYQERPAAYVSVSGSADRDGEGIVPELSALVRDRFPKWWTPDEFRFVEEIPRTSTGKFDKKSLREQFDQSSGGDAGADRE